MSKHSIKKGKPIYITQQTLKRRYRFSQKWIDRLGEPDKIVRNPHFSTAAPMLLWTEDRVLRFILANSEAYCKQVESHILRSGAARSAAERRRLAQAAEYEQQSRLTMEWAKSVKIELEQPPEEVYELCRKRKSENKRRDITVSIRDQVNLVRREYSNYESLMYQLSEMTGADEAYPIIRRRVNQAIRREYGFKVDEEQIGDA